MSAAAALAATITVTTTADDLTPNDGSVSLREALTAIEAGNALGDPDIIAENPGIFGVSDTITLAAPGGAHVYDLGAVDNMSVQNGANGLPIVTKPLMINGNGATIQRTGTTTFRIFQVDTGGALTLNAVTVSGGSAPGGSGAGGGILLTGTSNALTLTDSTVTNNTAGVFGGGIAVQGMSETVTLTRSTVSNNTAASGGGIEVQAGQVTLTLDHSAVNGNTAQASSSTVDGGGISISGGPLTITLTDSVVDSNTASTGSGSSAEGGGISSSAQAIYQIVGSTISNNSATAAGGVGAGGGFIDNGGAMVTLTNSTISGNSASGMIAFLGGGGIESDSSSTFMLNNVTVTDNSARQGGGIDVSSGSVVLANTILAGNAGSTGAPDCAGPLGTHGYNLFGTTMGCTVTLATGDLTSSTPKLGPLASNGGPTETHALLPGSPAIDAGNPASPGSGDGACAANDQRGIARPQPPGGRCDIGAYQLIGAVTSTTTTTVPAAGCTGVPTFLDIDCRLNLLIDQVSAAGDLGRLKKQLLSLARRTAHQKEIAEARHNAGQRRAARSFLKHAIQTLHTFDHTIKSLAGRHIIPAGTRATLLTMSGPIEADMRTLLGSL